MSSIKSLLTNRAFRITEVSQCNSICTDISLATNYNFLSHFYPYSLHFRLDSIRAVDVHSVPAPRAVEGIFFFLVCVNSIKRRTRTTGKAFVFALHIRWVVVVDANTNFVCIGNTLRTELLISSRKRWQAREIEAQLPNAAETSSTSRFNLCIVLGYNLKGCTVFTYTKTRLQFLAKQLQWTQNIQRTQHCAKKRASILRSEVFVFSYARRN